MSIFSIKSVSFSSIVAATLISASFNASALGQADRQNEIEDFDNSGAYVHLHNVKASNVRAENDHTNPQWGETPAHAHKMSGEKGDMMSNMMKEHHQSEGGNADHMHAVHPHTIKGGMGSHMKGSEYKDKAFGANN